MTTVPKWISRVSAIALATASVSAFADGPQFLMHQANVKFKVSSQGTGKIDNETYKTKNLINALMGRSVDDKNGKDEKLGLVTGCEANVDAAALVVYDKKNDVVMTGSGYIELYIEDAIVEVDKNGAPKKADVLGYVSEDSGWLDVTGQIKYGKIGNKVAKGDSSWDKNTICAKRFKSKSIVGAGIFGDIVMDGKISAGSAKFGADAGVYPGLTLAISKDAVAVNGDPVDFVVADDVISYEIVVTNVSGFLQATNVVVTDSMTSVDCGGVTTLNTGESVTCTADYTVTLADVDTACGTEGVAGPGTITNIATVTADGTTTFANDAVVDVVCAVPVSQ